MFHFLKHTFLHPLKEFFEDSKSIGILLLICAILSLCLSNFLVASNYSKFYDFEMLHVSLLEHVNTPKKFINEFLMSFFFLIVTLEIKREFVEGELSNYKKAITPIIAAIGGMLVPAMVYLLFTRNTQYANGWAIPTATDIAFTIGVASLLKNKVPNSLKIFLMALAIIDDLGAIIIIGLFYSNDIQISYLFIGVAILIILYIINKLNHSKILVQLFLGIALWYCILHSGIHASIAGVLFAITIPKQRLSSLQITLHKWVYFLILPLFILANTALKIELNTNIANSTNLMYAIFLGLVLGKPLGISLFSFIFSKLKIIELPSKISTQKFIGASCLAGIGFTMSLFVTQLAFSNVQIQNTCKLSVFLASVGAGVIGFVILLFSKNNHKPDEKNY